MPKRAVNWVKNSPAWLKLAAALVMFFLVAGWNVRGYISDVQVELAANEVGIQDNEMYIDENEEGLQQLSINLTSLADGIQLLNYRDQLWGLEKEFGRGCIRAKKVVQRECENLRIDIRDIREKMKNGRRIAPRKRRRR